MKEENRLTMAMAMAGGDETENKFCNQNCAKTVDRLASRMLCRFTKDPGSNPFSSMTGHS